MATSIIASVAASAAASRLRLQPLVCNFITVNGIASGFVSLKGCCCSASEAAVEAAEAVLLCKKLGHQAVTHPGSPSVLKNLDGKCMRENGQLSTR